MRKPIVQIISTQTADASLKKAAVTRVQYDGHTVVYMGLTRLTNWFVTFAAMFAVVIYLFQSFFGEVFMYCCQPLYCNVIILL